MILTCASSLPYKETDFEHKQQDVSNNSGHAVLGPNELQQTQHSTYVEVDDSPYSDKLVCSSHESDDEDFNGDHFIPSPTRDDTLEHYNSPRESETYTTPPQSIVSVTTSSPITSAPKPSAPSQSTPPTTSEPQTSSHNTSQSTMPGVVLLTEEEFDGHLSKADHVEATKTVEFFVGVCRVLVHKVDEPGTVGFSCCLIKGVLKDGSKVVIEQQSSDVMDSYSGRKLLISPHQTVCLMDPSYHLIARSGSISCGGLPSTGHKEQFFMWVEKDNFSHISRTKGRIRLNIGEWAVYKDGEQPVTLLIIGFSIYNRNKIASFVYCIRGAELPNRVPVFDRRDLCVVDFVSLVDFYMCPYLVDLLNGRCETQFLTKPQSEQFLPAYRALTAEFDRDRNEPGWVPTPNRFCHLDQWIESELNILTPKRRVHMPSKFPTDDVLEWRPRKSRESNNIRSVPLSLVTGAEVTLSLPTLPTTPPLTTAPLTTAPMSSTRTKVRSASGTPTTTPVSPTHTSMSPSLASPVSSSISSTGKKIWRRGESLAGLTEEQKKEREREQSKKRAAEHRRKKKEMNAQPTKDTRQSTRKQRRSRSSNDDDDNDTVQSVWKEAQAGLLIHKPKDPQTRELERRNLLEKRAAAAEVVTTTAPPSPPATSAVPTISRRVDRSKQLPTSPPVQPEPESPPEAPSPRPIPASRVPRHATRLRSPAPPTSASTTPSSPPVVPSVPPPVPPTTHVDIEKFDTTISQINNQLTTITTHILSMQTTLMNNMQRTFLSIVEKFHTHQVSIDHARQLLIDMREQQHEQMNEISSSLSQHLQQHEREREQSTPRPIPTDKRSSKQRRTPSPVQTSSSSENDNDKDSPPPSPHTKKRGHSHHKGKASRDTSSNDDSDDEKRKSKKRRRQSAEVHMTAKSRRKPTIDPSSESVHSEDDRRPKGETYKKKKSTEHKSIS